MMKKSKDAVWIRGVPLSKETWHKLKSKRLQELVNASSREELITNLIEQFIERFGKDVEVIEIRTNPTQWEQQEPEPEKVQVKEEPEIENRDMKPIDDPEFNSIFGG